MRIDVICQPFVCDDDDFIRQKKASERETTCTIEREWKREKTQLLDSVVECAKETATAHNDANVNSTHASARIY